MQKWQMQGSSKAEDLKKGVLLEAVKVPAVQDFAWRGEVRFDLNLVAEKWIKNLVYLFLRRVRERKFLIWCAIKLK